MTSPNRISQSHPSQLITPNQCVKVLLYLKRQPAPEQAQFRLTMIALGSTEPSRS